MALLAQVSMSQCRSLKPGPLHGLGREAAEVLAYISGSSRFQNSVVQDNKIHRVLTVLNR